MARRAPRTARWLRRATVALAVHALVLVGAATAHAGIVVSPDPVMAAEGSSPATYDVSLSTTPSGDVRLEFDTGGQLEPIPSIVLSSANYGQTYTVEVHAVDDDVAEASSHAAEVRHRLVKVSDGTVVSPWGSPKHVDIIDNDYAGYFVVGSGTGPDAEGDRLAFAISLASQPTSNVTITFASEDDDSVPAGGPLVFTPANWNVPQMTYLDIVDDDIAEGAHGTTFAHRATSADPMYDGWTHAANWLAISDDDVPGISLDAGPSGRVDVTEGATPGTYTIRLASRPAADVDIDVAPLNGHVDVSPSLITFTTLDWSSPRMVTVTAVDDTIQESSTWSSRCCTRPTAPIRTTRRRCFRT